MSSNYNQAASLASSSNKTRGTNDFKSMQKKDIVESTIRIEDDDEESQILMEGSIENNNMHFNNNKENVKNVIN